MIYRRQEPGGRRAAYVVGRPRPRPHGHIKFIGVGPPPVGVAVNRPSQYIYYMARPEGVLARRIKAL